MTLSISNKSKNNITIANKGKGSDPTIGEAIGTIGEAEGTIGLKRTSISKQSKNTISISNIAKN